MDVLIIEDEPLAAQHLSTLLKECDASIQIIDVLDSVESSALWFKNNRHPQLVFMDVHLGDGLCFEIFNRVSVSSCIIFTTAYDQYALEAFKVKSIDYILKPITKQALSQAVQKYKDMSFENERNAKLSDMSQILDAIQNKKSSYKERFVVKVGAHIRPVKTDEIACFYSFEKATYLVTNEGKTYLLDYALDKLMDLIDPSHFFRISRKYIVSVHAIKDVISVGPARLKVKIEGFQEDDTLVSRDKIKGFKEWMEG